MEAGLTWGIQPRHDSAFLVSRTSSTHSLNYSRNTWIIRNILDRKAASCTFKTGNFRAPHSARV
jgi:hypothetical protein